MTGNVHGVDNSSQNVEKIGEILERLGADSGTLQPFAAIDGLTLAVGSARSLRPSGAETSGSLDEEIEELERSRIELRSLNATTERELLEGYGRCGRCGGTGAITTVCFGSRGAIYVDCPRCNGTGRKG